MVNSIACIAGIDCVCHLFEFLVDTNRGIVHVCGLWVRGGGEGGWSRRWGWSMVHKCNLADKAYQSQSACVCTMCLLPGSFSLCVRCYVCSGPMEVAAAVHLLVLPFCLAVVVRRSSAG